MVQPITSTKSGLVEEPSSLKKQKQRRLGPLRPGGLMIGASKALTAPRIFAVSVMNAFVTCSIIQRRQGGHAPRGGAELGEDFLTLYN